MIRENLLTVHFKKRETALKWLFFSFGYFVLFVFLENPMKKTISLIGREHIILFNAFCIIYSIGMVVNLTYMNRVFHIKNKLFYYLSLVMSLLFGYVATTLMYDKSVGDVTLFATICHWIFGFGGILVSTVSVLVFLLAFRKEKKSSALTAVFWISTITCILDLLSFLLLSILAKGNVQESKNGFLEIVPMTVTFFVIYIINHTDLVSPRKERDEKEAEIKPVDSSIFSAVCFAVLCAAFTAFTLFAFVRNPIHFTISMTGIDYPIGFAVTSILLALALVLNFILMFIRNGYKNILAWAFAVVGSLSIIVCVVSPTKLGTELDMVHSVAAIAFFVCTLASFILYYFRFRKDKKRKPFLFLTIAVLAGMLGTAYILFVALEQKYGRTGMTEVVPLEFMFLCFLLENFSEYFITEKQTVKMIK